MRSYLFLSLLPLVSVSHASTPSTSSVLNEPARVSAPADTVNQLFVEALSHGRAFEQLRELTARYPGRLAGSTALEGAVSWAEQVLTTMKLDRVEKQSVLVPHWERGPRESVRLLSSNASPIDLAAWALGNSAATPPMGLSAEIIQVQSLDELTRLGHAAVAGKIVFFNRPMDPGVYLPSAAYARAGDQRNRGPAAASALGAVGALTRSLTQSIDDVPHTGNTTFPPNTPAIPSAALSTLASNRLAEALEANPNLRVEMKVNARNLPNAPSHNVIGEIRGSEFPEEVLLVGGHLDSWDISPGAHDDGAGVVQSLEVLRLFQTLGLKPRHTIRCVLFTAEENSLAGATAYAAAAKAAGEKHVFAIESDTGGFLPVGIQLGSTQGDPHLKAQRWLELFQPWGVWQMRKGPAGADVAPLMLQGTTVAQITPDAQRYFHYHHTAIDTIDNVNPRELHLGAAAMAAIIWLVDTEGL